MKITLRPPGKAASTSGPARQILRDNPIRVAKENLIRKEILIQGQQAPPLFGKV
jgi:hypothetical protein